jgi:hypothetical protein
MQEKLSTKKSERHNELLADFVRTGQLSGKLLSAEK